MDIVLVKNLTLDMFKVSVLGREALCCLTYFLKFNFVLDGRGVLTLSMMV